jgi:hypothetical protein
MEILKTKKRKKKWLKYCGFLYIRGLFFDVPDSDEKWFYLQKLYWQRNGMYKKLSKSVILFSVLMTKYHFNLYKIKKRQI